ncbi:MAG: hypothetical protein V4485_01380 [Pseudomonadota bacterium]
MVVIQSISKDSIIRKLELLDRSNPSPYTMQYNALLSIGKKFCDVIDKAVATPNECSLFCAKRTCESLKIEFQSLNAGPIPALSAADKDSISGESIDNFSTVVSGTSADDLLECERLETMQTIGDSSPESDGI